MNVVEIILLAGGIAVFIASYFVGNKKEEPQEKQAPVNSELTEEDKAKIAEQVENIIHDKIEDVTEQTEAKMDKISNTKILELNDYAETIMSEINKNHNETVFLYDMLNEKAKEVRNTVKDVNIARKEVDKIASRQADAPDDVQEPKQGEVKAKSQESENAPAPAKINTEGLNNQIDTSLYTNINKVSDGNNEYGYKTPAGSKDLAKERLIEIMKNASKTQAEESSRAKAAAEPPKPKTGLELVSRASAEKAAAQKAEAERLEAERLEAERLEAERLEAERLEAEKKEAERIKAEREAVQRAEAERLETERKEVEKAEVENAVESITEQQEAEKKEPVAQKPKRSRKKSVMDALTELAQEAAVSIDDDDSVGMSAQAGAMEVPDGTVELSAKTADSSDSENSEKKPKAKTVKKVSRRTVTKKVAVSQAGELVKLTTPKAEDIVAGFDEYMTNSDKIMELSKQGIGNKEIAKVLNVGLGEVKLIVDLLNSSD